MSMAEDVPNPGSDAALDLGCRCPVLDNNHGRTPPWPPAGWWIAADCTLHAGPATLSDMERQTLITAVDDEHDRMMGPGTG